jgi:beta-xylosidase
MARFVVACMLSFTLALSVAAEQQAWTPDNGNGSYTNPLFYDELADPDLIRVGEWFYLTGATMHAVPGLPLLRSKDLVNWELLGYAAGELDFGPKYRLEGGKNIYGQGLWAPSLRHHNGVFYLFANVNGRGTWVYSAINPKGPWARWRMKRSLQDLSVLFDDDGKAYAVWGRQKLRIAQLTDDLIDIMPGTERELFAKSDGMGGNAHFYKFNGKYYILSADDAAGAMPAARADRVYGPYEVNRAISKDEGFGMAGGYRLKNKQYPFEVAPPNPASTAMTAMHQGGIVLTEAGEWWGFGMMDYNSVGRLLSLSPVTWQDGWPYFGLPGNLGRSPRTWVKPRTAQVQAITTPFARSDDFSEPVLKPVWQWNHMPADDKWSLSERPGFLRLRSMPAASLWDARNALTQRAIGPVSVPTVELDASGLLENDVAGLGLLNLPFATLGVEKKNGKLALVLFDQARNQAIRLGIVTARVWLRAECDFLTEKARFSYSFDGVRFQPIGQEFTMIYQPVTAQGVRYALFNYNTGKQNGGAADFASFELSQPYPHGLRRPIPYGQTVQFASFRGAGGLAARGAALAGGAPSPFTVLDLGLGRAALQSGNNYLTAATDGSVSLQPAQSGVTQAFQWIETPTGELVLMSPLTNRFLHIDPKNGAVRADAPGPLPDGSDGARFIWSKK